MEVDLPAAEADGAANGKSAKGRRGRILGSKNGVRKVWCPECATSIERGKLASICCCQSCNVQPQMLKFGCIWSTLSTGP